jgi:aspartyl-tRNA(Asn)/glutamyl-tRNA(Gln) amidotransferase subunit A
MDSTAQPLHATGAGGFGFAAAAREGGGDGGGGGGGAAGDGLPLAGLVVGIPDEYFVAEMPPATIELWTRGVEWLVAAGATAVSVSLPHTRHALPTYCLLSSAEAASNLARYDGIRYGASEAFRGGEQGGEGGEGGEGLSALAATRSLSFGPEVQRRILTGCFVASAGAVEDYYEKALLVRRSVAADFDAAFAAGVDVLLTPTTPGAAFEIAGCREGDVDPVTMFLNDVMTVPASLAGLPAISVPAALTEGVAATAAGAPAQPRLPLGLQLVGGAMREATLLRAAAALEARAGFELLDGLR